MNLEDFFSDIIHEEGDDLTTMRDKVVKRIKDLSDELVRSDALASSVSDPQQPEG